MNRDDAAQYEDQDDTSSTLNGDEDQPADEEANIRIFLRVKPSRKPSGFFSWDEDSNMMKYDIPKDVAAGLINNSRTTYKFRFDSVIGMEAKQEEVFDRVGRPCVESALNGFNSTVFAYGQTGSGKTFTITGGAERYEDRGLIPRALSVIFERMRNNSQEQIIAHVSYLEIYNNQGYDLLDPNHESTKSLDDLPRVAMLEDEDGNCHLRNLSMHPVTAEEDALNLLFLGDTNRAVSETAMNLASSRSHCIFTVSLETRRVGSEVVLRSKLHLVDLAGSERAHKTGAKGQLLREAAYINTSLHYLEMVIVALHEKNTKGRTHIPYRNSMMTSVLRDSLGGNLARVKNDARLNEEVDPAVIIRQLKARVANLEEELAILKGDVVREIAGIVNLLFVLMFELLWIEQNEGAELKEYEFDKLRQKCLNFVNDPEPSAHLAMGEFTYTKMKACFDILKSMANAAGTAAATNGNSNGIPGASSGIKLISAGNGGNNQEMEQRVHELEQLVQQRDNEIAIMVNMIRKEHGAAISPELLSRGLAEYTSNQDEHQPKSQKRQSIPKPPEDYTSTLVVDPAILEDPAKAFEAFKAQYPKNDVIRDNKVALKRKYDAAKTLASEVNDARNQIKALTLKIEKLRKQQAIVDEGLLDTGIEGGDRESSSSADNARAEMEAAEQKLREQIDAHKITYKKGFNQLSELKKEIQHIQKMLEMGRIKLQKDFDLWYHRQGKAALLTETLLAQAKPGTTRSNNSKEHGSEILQEPTRSSSSPDRPESNSCRTTPRKTESKASMESKTELPAQSGRLSALRQSTARYGKVVFVSMVAFVLILPSCCGSTVEEDVSGFYEALDILKRPVRTGSRDAPGGENVVVTETGRYFGIPDEAAHLWGYPIEGVTPILASAIIGLPTDRKLLHQLEHGQYPSNRTILSESFEYAVNSGAGDWIYGVYLRYAARLDRARVLSVTKVRELHVRRRQEIKRHLTRLKSDQRVEKTNLVNLLRRERHAAERRADPELARLKAEHRNARSQALLLVFSVVIEFDEFVGSFKAKRVHNAGGKMLVRYFSTLHPAAIRRKIEQDVEQAGERGGYLHAGGMDDQD
ncbi:unnamed protein product [Phytophthora fragariaefolia]|uniref:Unnamed protein product n=1 Tax=Phytophthora fragariaefolia TaxID=1490495 RepID=A0A9W6YBZ1_9STRA|nr:unnamed protein product [Phytophthora fragariaefolia]